MDKVPRLPSKSETRAQVRCKGEEQRLSSKKEELDKVWQAESRYLRASRNRFVTDRRRSMGNVYNSQIEGIQPHMRIRRRKRDSDPEVINIFRRQEDRRKTIQVIENEITEDVLCRLERKYQEALARTGSVEEDASSESDTDVTYIPGLDSVDSDSSQRTSTDRNQASHATRLANQAKDIDENQELDRRATSEDGTEEQRFENRDRYDNKVTESAHKKDITIADPLQVPEVPNQKLTRQEQIKRERRRKRSYSDGNISVNIFQLHNTDMHPFILAKNAAEASFHLSDEQSASDTQIEDLGSGSLTDDNQTVRCPDNSMKISKGETFVIETDVTDSALPTPRHAGGVPVDLLCPDMTAPPSVTRRRGDVKFRSTVEYDVTTSPLLHGRYADNSNSHNAEFTFSPSLRRRLAGSNPTSPRRETTDNTNADITNSPTTPRRRGGEYAMVGSKTTRQESDPLSPTLTRRRRDNRPKAIYQQEVCNKPAPKPRPLRRSRSEAVDLSQLTSHREKDFLQVPRSERRGSDSFQGLANAEFSRRPPKSWNSLLYGLALNQEEREDIARHKRMELVTSLRKRQMEVDSDVSKRIQTFLQRYDV